MRTVDAVYATATFQQDIMVAPEVCGFGASLIQAAEKVGGWIPATTIGVDGKPMDNVDRRADTLPIARARSSIFALFEDSTKELVGRLLNAYARHSPYLGRACTQVPGAQDEGYDLLRYKVGDEYREHIDASFNADRALKHVRRLSVLLYLNEDFAGGELYFPRQDVTVRPRVGMAVAFPSTFAYPHSAAPVRSGVKYALATWIF